MPCPSAGQSLCLRSVTVPTSCGPQLQIWWKCRSAHLARERTEQLVSWICLRESSEWESRLYWFGPSAKRQAITSTLSIGGSVKLKPLQNILQLLYKLINYSGLHIRAQWRKQLIPLRSGRPWAPCATQAHKDSCRNTGLWLQLDYIYAILLLQALCKHPQCTCQRCYACVVMLALIATFILRYLYWAFPKLAKNLWSVSVDRHHDSDQCLIATSWIPLSYRYDLWEEISLEQSSLSLYD